MAYKTIKQEQTEIFYQDLENLGFNFTKTKRELALLRECPTENDYIRASRVGFDIAITRKQRKEIYNSYETWMKEI